MSAAPVSYYDMTLAKIRERILNADVSRKAIAAGVGISQAMLRRKLSGETALTVSEIDALARVLGCRMSEIVA
ncbi:helix-turn-helix domain-containing protein [Specibacter sp. RAF43]|uniref:helix-turn-helix domain-containing protein n=1 Tax=Specibacter sp. RAF43 TaxID=3233057 RepID=UPI003F978F32